MIIGNVSIDPRRVMRAEILQEYMREVVRISCLYGDTVSDTDAVFSDRQLASEALQELDKVCYKGPLADAISDKEIEDEDDDDLSGKIGFKLDRN
jgi:hypothetical protein